MSAELPDPGFEPGSIFRFLELRIRVQAALAAGDSVRANKWQRILETQFPVWASKGLVRCSRNPVPKKAAPATGSRPGQQSGQRANVSKLLATVHI
jgi:hypothetical protein